jgi:hypothetical protein
MQQWCLQWHWSVAKHTADIRRYIFKYKIYILYQQIYMYRNLHINITYLNLRVYVFLFIHKNLSVEILEFNSVALFVFGATALSRPWLPHSRGFKIAHNDVSQSVRLLLTSDQFVAGTSVWQHTTLTTDKHHCPRWNSNPQSQQASGRPQTYALERAATGTE